MNGARWAALAAIVSIGIAGCESDGAESTPKALPSHVCEPVSLQTPANAPEGCDLYVEPGEDDQTAVQGAFVQAQPGQTLCLAAGTFNLRMEVAVTASHLTVRGAGIDDTILDFDGQDVGANGISITGDYVTFEDLTVKNTAGDGIRATGVKDIVFRRIGMIWDADASLDNGAYGLYPVGCDGVLVEDSKVKGARDAGIYVGQSTRILVRNNQVWGNVAGIEIENSTDAEVVDNHTWDNTAGILVFNLPDLPITGGKRAKIHNNLVENNNLPSFAEKGSIVSLVPHGVGMLILACDDNEITANTVVGNQSVGIVIVDYNPTMFGSYSDKDFDVTSEGNHIHGNTFTNNGYEPAGILSVLLKEPRPLPAVVWDGCSPGEDDATKTCVHSNVDDAGGDPGFMNADLCGDTTPSFDATPHDCTHPAVPSTEFGTPPEPPKPEDSGPLAVERCSKLSGYNWFYDGTKAAEPVPGVLPYTVAAPLWADNSGKDRFMILPEGETVTYTDTGDWQLPVGTVLVKHFFFPRDLREPEGDQRILETRLLVKDPDGWRAETYIWDEAETDATYLLSGARVEVDHVDAAGQPATQTYLVPNRNLCASCHFQDDEIKSLGLITHQMNVEVTREGKTVNQLDWLAGKGAFSAALPAQRGAFPDPYAGEGDTEARARAYLHANCAHCHRDGGAAGDSGLDLSHTQDDPVKYGVCKKPAAAGAGTGGRGHDIVPGDPDESIMVYRMASTNPAIKMPELPSQLVDEAGVQLITEWIAGMEGGCPE